MKNKCILLHGPPETDLSLMVGQISACLKAVVSSVEKVHLPLSASYTRVHIIALLYDNGKE